MKVLMINGSPHETGCTYTALCEIEKTLQAQEIETEILQVGTEPLRGCVACGACVKNPGKCAFGDGDGVNAAIENLRRSDALIIGTPVHYAAAGGALTSFLARMFYAARGAFRYKPGAAICVARRGGIAPAFDQLNKYFTISSMPIVSSQYWNMVYGTTPEEVAQDLEGMQTMRTLANNMAWLLRCIEAGRAANVLPPEPEAPQRTNFIR